MPGLLPHVDPDGLLEFSVVYTDRALNHMSRSFQGVMKDISRILKTVYHAKSAVLVPGSGTFGMEAVARQFAGDKKVLVIRNGWFSYRWTQIFDMGRIPAESTVLKARRTGTGSQAPWTPAPIAEVVATIRDRKPDVVFAPHVETACGMILPDDYLKAVADAVHGRRPVRAGLHRLRRDVGRHEGHRGGRAGFGAAEGMEQLALLRHGDAQRARPCRHRRHHELQLRLRPEEMAADHGSL